jgi:hypothetical protein
LPMCLIFRSAQWVQIKFMEVFTKFVAQIWFWSMLVN